MRYKTWTVSQIRFEYRREIFREGGLVSHCTSMALSQSRSPAGPTSGRLGGSTSVPVCGRTSRSKHYKRPGIVFRERSSPSLLDPLPTLRFSRLASGVCPLCRAYASRHSGVQPTLGVVSPFVGMNTPVRCLRGHEVRFYVIPGLPFRAVSIHTFGRFGLGWGDNLSSTRYGPNENMGVS